MIRSVADWQSILFGKSPMEQARAVLGDLRAYPSRNSSRYSEDDERQLAHVLQAMRQIASEDVS